MFELQVQKIGSHAENVEDFKPTPIPLIDWPSGGQEAAGTLHEIIKTDAPPAVAAVPAHYWEDALRHSVYLTLVRDKIDQLIANGDVISPDRKPENLSQEVDDHDLWEKIKTAKFDRLKEEPIPPSDITILAKGRLLEDLDGYRFAEDNTTQSNCSPNCTKDVKAFWSVKRVRQGEHPSGKYHYELTFSVTSQSQTKNKVLKKPYENPVRTFTIKENTPTERPQTRKYEQPLRVERPQRAIWVHKNINPAHSYHKRPTYVRGLDRIFSSLFSDEDSDEEPSYRYKQKAFMPHMYPHHAKAAYVDDREPYHKKLIPYPIPKPQGFRYNHPPIPPPPYIQHPYLNVDNTGNNPYVPPTHTDNRFGPSNVVKTTRPAVLPTPITNHPLLKESSVEAPVKTTKPNSTEHTTKDPDVSYKIYSHPKQPPMKVGFFPDHIRPPVYNAPPGVFVTMDKKPFKPMPPLKYTHNNKPHKTLPSDFRPSPQIVDTQYNDADPATDTAFRPITINYTDIEDVFKKGNKNSRKPTSSKKPPKKGEFIKSPYRPTIITTTSPEIITAIRDVVEEDPMDWANILGAFTKTTPMASHREKGITESVEITSTTSHTPTTSEENSYEEFDESTEITARPTTTSSTTTTTTTTTTTPKPTKRTRPPPKFTKQDKIKKHKRVTSTTTTTTTSTTAKPSSTKTYKQKKQTDDLTPQASSAATSGANSVWEQKTPKAPVSTTSSTTTRPTTTTQATTTTTTTTTPSTIVDTEQPVVTTQPKSKNRFRQSTLMQKGTSVNHDKWSTVTLEKNRTNSIYTNKLPLRRKASKFQGYIPVSTPRGLEVERDREDHKDHAYNEITEKLSASTTEETATIPVKPLATTPTIEKQEVKNSSSKWHHQHIAEDDDDDEDEEDDDKDTDSYDPPSKDDIEYIFPTASNATTHVTSSAYNSIEPTTVATTDSSPYPTAINKTKCKKKKLNLTTTEEPLQTYSETEPVTVSSSTPSTTTITTTTTKTTSTSTEAVSDMFSELFGGFTMDDITEKPKTGTTPSEPKESGSEKHEHYAHIDDDLEEFLHSLDKKNNQHVDNKTHSHHTSEEYDDDESPFNNDDENANIKGISDEYYDEGSESQESRDQPFSILELMAME